MLDSIEEGFEAADLEQRQLVMLRYVKKLTVSPSDIVEADLKGLRDAGFAAADILGIAECAAYYAYANRLANGLGARLESD